MADVVVRLARHLDVEAGIARHLERLAGTVGLPLGLAGELDAARARHRLHDLGRAGVEGERGRQDHADRFLGAVGQRDAVRHALAVEIDVGLGNHRYIVELGHLYFFLLASSLAAMRMRSALSLMKPPASFWS